MPGKDKKKGLVKVRVHTCFSPEVGERLPSVCACNVFVSQYRARRWVATGRAVKVFINKRNSPGNICQIGGSSIRTPRCATIEKAHIERAYVKGDLEEKVRIDEYGQLTKAAWTDLIHFVDPIEFDKREREDYGIPVVSTPGDGRTAGGIGKYSWERERQ